MAERKQVIPGDVIAKGEFRFGPNIERRGDEYVALRVGYAEVTREGILRLNPLTGPYMPRADDLVVGKVVDMNGFGWVVDINSCFYGYLPASFVFGREFSPSTHDLSTKFKIGDIIGAKIETFDRSRDPQLSIRGEGFGLIPSGEIIRIPPTKVPRLIGRRGATINMISERTNTDIKVGQNGLMVIAGPPEGITKAVEAVKMIRDEANSPELMERVERLLGVTQGGN